MKLQQSLDPALWIDDNHIVPTRTGNQVFDREKDAVKKLNGPDQGRKSSIADPTLQELIDALVRADQSLAQVALGDAIAASGDPKKIAESQNELVKAADEITKLHFDHAIDHYKTAWKKARRGGSLTVRRRGGRASRPPRRHSSSGTSSSTDGPHAACRRPCGRRP